jgi:hypothetical protein
MLTVWWNNNGGRRAADFGAGRDDGEVDQVMEQ